VDDERSGSRQFDEATAGPPSHDPEPRDTPIRLRGDELDLYSEFHRVLFRTVLRRVNASVDTVQDACSFAWVQFLREQPDRERNWKGWMVTTARREAWRLNAIEWNERESFDPDREPRTHGPDERYELRMRFEAALVELKKLPPPLQRVVLVRSQVWKGEEVAGVLGMRPDQVEPLLRAAAIQLAKVNENRHDRERPVASPRAARLRELEDEPPEWLTKVIGQCPHRSKSSAGVILSWRRAALAIDDYRRTTSYEHPREAIGFVPRDHDQKRAYIRAERAILRVASECERRHGVER
jgi:DNA-directed RNA polymerase specialized sigma24 family protein